MKLSIIVPCYNVAQYLPRCLMSLTNQSLTDMEIICIDDKSTDNTLDVLRDWEKGDLRIRVIENDENMGVGFTRNRGIDLAKGEFVGFVDPDDWIDTDFYKKLIDVAEKTQTPVVCGDIVEHPVNGKPFKKKIEVKKSHYHWMYSWSAVYLREFLNRYNLHFPRLVIAEDSVFESSVKVHMPKPIIHVKGVAYHYFRRVDGANVRVWTDKQTQDYISAVNQIVDIFNMADHVSPEDYHLGVIKYYFLHLCHTIYYNGPEVAEKIAIAVCDIAQRLKYPQELIKRRHALFLALRYNNPQGVIDVLKADRWYHYAYCLPGIKRPIVLVSHNSRCKKVKVFGIPVLERHLSSPY
ncbi:MAG: glycosyltransferase family 2 protein [Alphaproteobacteria bacterium]|nr:glycosyltransferase family 2 protein [Alphaproteobacteria bacterium]